MLCLDSSDGAVPIGVFNATDARRMMCAMNRRVLDLLILGLAAVFAGGWAYALYQGSSQAASLYRFILLTCLVALGVIHRDWVYGLLSKALRRYRSFRERQILRQAERRRSEEMRLMRIENDAHNQEVMYLQRHAAPHLMLGLHPVEFERFVLRYFRLLGFDAQETKATGDGGIDGVLRRDGRLFVIQCKRYAGNSIGEPPIRDLLGAVTKVRAAGGIFITTSEFTSAAMAFAEGTCIELIDGEALATRIRGLTIVDPKDRPVATHPSSNPSNSIRTTQDI